MFQHQAAALRIESAALAGDGEESVSGERLGAFHGMATLASEREGEKCFLPLLRHAG